MNKLRQKGHFLRFGIGHPLDRLRLKKGQSQGPEAYASRTRENGEEKGKSSLFTYSEWRKEIRGQTIRISEHKQSQNINHVAGQPLAGLVVVGIDALSLEDGEARMPPIPHDLHQAGRGLFPCQQRFDELVPEQLHDPDRIGARDGDQGALRRNQAVRDQTVKVRMKPGGFVSIGLQGGDHAGQGVALPGGLLEELLDRGIEALPQQAEQLAVVLEAEPEHFGDGHNVLADGEIAQDLLVDMLRKEQGTLLMAGGTETPSSATIGVISECNSRYVSRFLTNPCVD